MPINNRSPLNADNDDDHYEELVDRQIEADKNYDTIRNYNSISYRFYCSGSKRGWRTVYPLNCSKKRGLQH